MKRRGPDQLPALITSFFHEHLQRIRGASPHTVRAYALTVRLYLGFLADHRDRSLAHLRLEDLDYEGVTSFLEHLERTRGNGIRTRNHRLAALRTFFHHLFRQDTLRAAQYHRVLALPAKKGPARLVTYLEPEQVRVILAQPDPRTPAGLRDQALLLFLYNTGARIGEALALRAGDIEFAPPATVRLRGKGNRERFCPLWRGTTKVLRRLADSQPSSDGFPLFQNASGKPLTRDGAAYVLKKYVHLASRQEPLLRKLRISPHVLRHSCAVALLQSGVDLTVIRDYLGHASIATTNHYVSTNLAMKRDVLAEFWKRAGLGPPRTAPRKPTPAVLRFLASL